MTFLPKVYYSEMLTTKLNSKEKPQGLYSAVAHVYLDLHHSNTEF